MSTQQTLITHRPEAHRSIDKIEARDVDAHRARAARVQLARSERAPRASDLSAQRVLAPDTSTVRMKQTVIVSRARAARVQPA